MISKLHLENWRSFTDQKFNLENRTVIFGPNGSGKSSILEAIRIVSVGKSFRTSRTEEIIHFDQMFCRVGLSTTKKDQVEFFYGTQFTDSPSKERQLTVGGQTISWIEYIGTLPTVLFTPTDIDLVLGSPDGRRRYLDSILWQVDKNYRQAQLEYSQVLRERSALLYMVKINRASQDELTPWNQLLTKLSQTIRSARNSYVEYLGDWLTKNAQNDLGRVEVKYQFDPKSIEEILQSEIRSAQNLFGAHRDELVVEFNDLSARRYASRGQSRLGVVHLKAAEADYLAETTENTVTILLDDVFSELDQKNADKLLTLFNSNHQLILTSAHKLQLKDKWTSIEL